MAALWMNARKEGDAANGSKPISEDWDGTDEFCQSDTDHRNKVE
jgi:hypothetical protein